LAERVLKLPGHAHRLVGLVAVVATVALRFLVVVVVVIGRGHAASHLIGHFVHHVLVHLVLVLVGVVARASVNTAVHLELVRLEEVLVADLLVAYVAGDSVGHLGGEVRVHYAEDGGR